MSGAVQSDFVRTRPILPLRLLFALATGMLVSSCVFLDLQEDLEKLGNYSLEYSGTISATSTALIVVAFANVDGSDVSTFRVMPEPGEFQLLTKDSETYLFGFHDRNFDLTFQSDEEFGWANSGEKLVYNELGSNDIAIVVGSNQGLQPPPALLESPLVAYLVDDRQFNFDTISSLDDNLLSLEHAKVGLWQPFAFIESGGVGIHFLEPYDSKRIPILFVHGVQGSPANFTTLIKELDKDKYQAWVFSYPSGMRLDTISKGLFQFLEVARLVQNFKQIHIVAHSMGGLVARGMINECLQGGPCSHVQSLTTISTPWNGVASAKSGVKWAPTVVPVWLDLDPDSIYITTLFDTPLPDDIPHYLIFGFYQDSIFGASSSNGVIELSS